MNIMFNLTDYLVCLLHKYLYLCNRLFFTRYLQSVERTIIKFYKIIYNMSSMTEKATQR